MYKTISKTAAISQKFNISNVLLNSTEALNFLVPLSLGYVTL